MKQTLFLLLQQLLPQHALSRLVGRLADCRVPWLKNLLIRRFIAAYGVNMQEAQAEAPEAARQANWLPVKAGEPFLLNARLYWPKPEALDGRWGMPGIEKLD